MPTVTTPCSPYEPSSVIIITSSELCLTSSSNIIRSFERPANTDRTRFPAAFSARMMGNIGATPTPPPAQTTVPKFSICVGLPSGPTTSVTYSPSLRLHSLIDERPTFCTTSVIVPFVVSASAMVSGIRSPLSPTLTITKFPAFLLLAISGASMSKRYTFSENCSFLIILFMALQLMLIVYVKYTSRRLCLGLKTLMRCPLFLIRRTPPSAFLMFLFCAFVRLNDIVLLRLSPLSAMLMAMGKATRSSCRRAFQTHNRAPTPSERGYLRAFDCSR